MTSKRNAQCGAHVEFATLSFSFSPFLAAHSAAWPQLGFALRAEFWSTPAAAAVAALSMSNLRSLTSSDMRPSSQTGMGTICSFGLSSLLYFASYIMAFDLARTCVFVKNLVRLFMVKSTSQWVCNPARPIQRGRRVLYLLMHAKLSWRALVPEAAWWRLVIAAR